MYFILLRSFKIDKSNSSKSKFFVGTIETLFEEEKDDFDKNIDIIEFMFDDSNDETLNNSVELFESQLNESKIHSDLLNDGLDEVLNMAMDQFENNNKNVHRIPSNLLYAVQKSKKEILHNKLMAKIRLIENKNKRLSECFKLEVADFFYPIESWPNYAIHILLSEEFSYSNRLGLAAFFHGNGLKDHLKAERIFKFYN